MTRAIGVKSVAAVVIATILIAIGAAGPLNATYLGHLSAGACFLVALVASLAVGLVGIGWRFDVRSNLAIALVRPVPSRLAGPSTASGTSTRIPKLTSAGTSTRIPRVTGAATSTRIPRVTSAGAGTSTRIPRMDAEPTPKVERSRLALIARERPIVGRGVPSAGSETESPSGWIAGRGVLSAGSETESPSGWVAGRGVPSAGSEAEWPSGWIELPGMAQRAALLVGFAAAVLGALGNHAAARIAQLPDELAEPSPSEYCMPPPPPAANEPPPPPVVVESEQPGCALVKRAFALGYAKSLGACAPKAVAPVVVSPVTKREVCTRRQLDEPMLHYGFRRVAEAFSATTSVDPVDATQHRVAEIRTHIQFVDGLLANINHAITGTPHATHHLWVNLPDPHPTALSDHFVGEERCSQRFADLPLWPAWRPGDEARLVEHVLGQLLFATRFGSTASCSDYVIHWGAAPNTCERLARDPIAVLADSGALVGVRAVLDRRRRQLELGALAIALGKQPRDVPPAASAIASLSCFIIDPSASGAATGSMVAIDGDPVGLREIRVRAVRTETDGPIDVYAGLATLLAGKDGSLAVATVAGADGAPVPVAAATSEPVEPRGGEFLLAQLDPLFEADPFRGARAALQRADLVEVFPFQRHLHAFIDGFRRRYLAQRGRL